MMITENSDNFQGVSLSSLVGRIECSEARRWIGRGVPALPVAFLPNGKKPPGNMGKDGKHYPLNGWNTLNGVTDPRYLSILEKALGNGQPEGWGRVTDEVGCLDLDLKCFPDPDLMEQAVSELTGTAPNLTRTRSGGLHIDVEGTLPSGGNIGLGDIPHVGELLGKDAKGNPQFVVISGPGYEVLKAGEPLNVNSLSDHGITLLRKRETSTEVPSTPPPALKVLPGGAGTASLQKLLTKNIQKLIQSNPKDSTVSDAIATLANEAYGWENLASQESVPLDESADKLIHQVAESWGKLDKLPRMLASINRESCSTALEHAKGRDAAVSRLRFMAGGSTARKPVDEKDAFRVEKSVEQHVFENFFESGKGNWAVINQGFYRYTGEGYWQHTDDASIEKALADYLMECYREMGVNKIRVHNVATDKAVVSAFKFARKALSVSPNRGQSSHLRCFNNGTLDTKTGELREHRKEDYLTSRIDSMFIAGRPCPEKFQEFIQSSFGFENLPLVRAIISMMLDPSAPWGYFLYIMGQSGGGKGTLIRFIQSLFDKDNVRAGNTFTDISTPEGRHQHLRSAALYCFPDMGGYVQGVRAFYELVDNGALSGRPLYNSTTYHEKFHTRFIVASVEPLVIENSGDGWERRAIVLPVIPGKRKKDPTLEQQLTSCKSDVISWALSMDREERDHLLLNSETASESAAEAKRSVTMTGDSVRQFIDLCLRPATSGEGAILAQIHDWYRAFSKSFGYSDMGASKLGARIQSIIPGSYEPRRKIKSNEPGYGPNKFRLAQYNVVDMPGLFDESETLGLTINKDQAAEGGLDAFCPVTDADVYQALTECRNWAHYCGVGERYGKDAITNVWDTLPAEIVQRIIAFEPDVRPPQEPPITEPETPAEDEPLKDSEVDLLTGVLLTAVEAQDLDELDNFRRLPKLHKQQVWDVLPDDKKEPVKAAMSQPRQFSIEDELEVF